MTLLKVEPDTVHLITEERLRFPVAADVPPQMVPFTVLRDLRKAIDILERFRGWRVLDAVPARKAFPGGVPCCTQIMERKPGESLTIKFLPSDFQGDTDDAHNFDEVSDPQKRLMVENTIDWVAVMHFWEPALVVDNGQEREFSKGLDQVEGFLRWEDIPAHAWPDQRKRFASG